jgi:multidrug transporter EmrE-like cation transporter
MKEMILSWGMLTLSVIFNAFGVFVIKLKLNELGPIKVDSIRGTIDYFFLLLKSPLVVVGVVLFFLAPFLFAIALSRMEIAVAYPVQIGLNFIILLLLALFVLGEQLTIYKSVAITLVLIGTIMLSRTS